MVTMTTRNPTQRLEESTLSDDEKNALHLTVRSAQERFLDRIGHAISDALEVEVHDYVEHSHNGVLLRVVIHEDQADLVQAMAEYAGLHVHTRNKTNESNTNVWMRFSLRPTGGEGE